MKSANGNPGAQSPRKQEEPVSSANENPTSRLAPYLAHKPLRGSTADAVTSILREAILDGVLESLTWLREEELAKELAVSRTPIREALGRLSVDGLITITAHQGAIVTPLSIEDVLQLFVVRERLEGLAARQAARYRSEQELQELEQIVARMEEAVAQQRLAELPKLNIAFHRAIRHAARNRFLDRFLTQAEQAFRPFGHKTYEIPGRIDAVITEHRQILAALKVGDMEVAEQLAMDHIRRARELRIRMFSEGYPLSGGENSRA